MLISNRPGARVVASDIDERAVACARTNGVEAYRGDLFAPLPASLAGNVDVIVGIVPYVPTPALPLLQRDTPSLSVGACLRGGTTSTEILRRVLTGGLRYLRQNNSK